MKSTEHGAMKPSDDEMNRVNSLLIQALADPEVEVRLTAARGLAASTGNLPAHPAQGVTISTLVAILSDPSPVSRAQAAEIIGYFGSKAAPAISLLIELLDDSDIETRMAAAWAVSQIDRLEKRSKTRLQEMTTDPEPRIQYRAKSALQNLESPPEQ